MTATLRFAALPLALTAAVLADLTPTFPGPGQSFNAGDNCTIKWEADESGSWTNVTIGACMRRCVRNTLGLTIRRPDVGL